VWDWATGIDVSPFTPGKNMAAQPEACSGRLELVYRDAVEPPQHILVRVHHLGRRSGQQWCRPTGCEEPSGLKAASKGTEKVNEW